MRIFDWARTASLVATAEAVEGSGSGARRETFVKFGPDLSERGFCWYLLFGPAAVTTLYGRRCGDLAAGLFLRAPSASLLVASEVRRPPMALHTAMIDGVQVPGFRYVVYGAKRGYVSTHRTKRAAEPVVG
jgi:hypothetical protein